MSPKFLTLTEVLEFHEDLIREFGGGPGIRDLGLAEAALAMPQSGGGEDELEAVTWKVASGKLDKSGAAAILEKIYNEHKAA